MPFLSGRWYRPIYMDAHRFLSGRWYRPIYMDAHRFLKSGVKVQQKNEATKFSDSVCVKVD